MRPFFQTLVRTALSSFPFAPSPPASDRGVSLDEQTHRLLVLLERAGTTSIEDLGPVKARIESERLGRFACLPPISVHRVEDQWIECADAAIAVRIYRPRSGPDRLPATVYYHGGGFVIGSLTSHDSLCRRLAVGSGSVVIAVDYRLAPEHPFPAAPNDACAAFDWVHRNAGELGIDAARIAVAGDSAGGNLATVVCQILHAAKKPMPSFQLLIYPAVDLTRSCDSHRTFAQGYLLTERMMDWFVATYLTDPAQERDPRGSPIMTRELAGLPAAHVMTAGFDPLRDEGEAYAEALMAAGVPTTARCYESLIHGFAGLDGLCDAAAHAVEDAAQILRRHHWQ